MTPDIHSTSVDVKSLYDVSDVKRHIGSLSMDKPLTHLRAPSDILDPLRQNRSSPPAEEVCAADVAHTAQRARHADDN